jgi:VWFA-related protein
MTSSVASTALSAGLLLAGTGAQETAPRSEGPPVFEAQLEMVVVDAVVVARDEGPLAGLRSVDFSVTEDGVPQAVTAFEAVDVSAVAAADAPETRPRVSANTGVQAMNARSFVLVLDQVHLSPQGADRAREAIARFLRFGPREGDTVMLVGTGGGSWWMTRIEEGKDALGPVLRRVGSRFAPNDTPERITDFEAMRIVEDRDPLVLEQVRRRFETYITGKSREAEGAPLRAQERLDEAARELVRDEEIRGRAQEAYHHAVVRNRTTLSALYRVLNSLTGIRGRKTVILLSEGFIRDTRLDEYDRVVRAARRANGALYFLDVRGLQVGPTDATAQYGPLLPSADVADQITQEMVSAEGADTLATDTGGFSIKNTNDLERGLRRIAQEARRYYLLGYVSSNPRRDGKWRNIKVSVARPDVEVRARKGYYALEGTGKKSARADRDWRPGLQEALDSPYEFAGIPLRLIHHVFGEAAPGKARALLTAEVDVRGLGFAPDGGVASDTLEVLFVATHRESGEFQRNDRKLELRLPADVRSSLERSWLRVERELELVPGGYQAKVVVRDRKTGKLGSVTQDFEVPGLDVWRTSTPVLSDALEKGQEGGPLRVVVPARRTFLSGGTLYFQFEVYRSAPDPASGLPRVVSGYSVRASDGAQVARGQPALIRPATDGRLARIGVVPLEGLSPGRYELVLDLRDELTGRTLEVREPFSIETALGGVTVTGPDSG